MSVKPDVTFHFRFRWHLLAFLFSLHFFLRPISPDEPDGTAQLVSVLQRDGFNWEGPGKPSRKKLYVFIVKHAFKEIVSENESLLWIVYIVTNYIQM